MLAAAGLFAKKSSESLVAFERLDSEKARLVTERDLTKRINNLADSIDASNKDRAKALQNVRDSVGDYDASWIQNFDAVWGAVSDEWFKGMDLTHDEEAQLRGMAESNAPNDLSSGRTPSNLTDRVASELKQ